MKRKLKLIFVTLVAVTVVGYVVAYLYAANSDAYRAALVFLKSREEIKSHIGEPASFRLAYTGWIVSFSGPKGEAQFQIYVHGPRGSGSAFIDQVSQVGVWKVKESNLVLDDGRVIPLQKSGEASPPRN